MKEMRGEMEQMKACDGVSLDGITRIVQGKYNYITAYFEKTQHDICDIDFINIIFTNIS